MGSLCFFFTMQGFDSTSGFSTVKFLDDRKCGWMEPDPFLMFEDPLLRFNVRVSCFSFWSKGDWVFFFMPLFGDLQYLKKNIGLLGFWCLKKSEFGRDQVSTIFQLQHVQVWHIADKRVGTNHIKIKLREHFSKHRAFLDFKNIGLVTSEEMHFLLDCALLCTLIRNVITCKLPK